jgi:hypothetical protein
VRLIVQDMDVIGGAMLALTVVGAALHAASDVIEFFTILISHVVCLPAVIPVFPVMLV